MKNFPIHLIVLFLLTTSCITIENRSNIPSEPQTIQQSMNDNPEKTDRFDWIDDDQFDEIWVFVDEFPEVVNGMRDLQQRITQTVEQNPADDCSDLKNEQVLYQFIINETGRISNITTNLREPNVCAELVEITIRVTEFTPGKVDGETVSTLFALPVNF